MRSIRNSVGVGAAVAALAFCGAALQAAPTPEPRFSVQHMDRSVTPREDFYRFAAGSWVQKNPVPADKARWGAFDELQERNWALIRDLLESAGKSGAAAGSPERQVADFYRSAMDTNRLERLVFAPLKADLARVESAGSMEDLASLLADFHDRGMDAMFNRAVIPDARNSGFYALYFGQGGLGLPDRDYYFSEKFATHREAYLEHIRRMLVLMGDAPEKAAASAQKIMSIETELAEASRTRTELRDPIANYNKFDVAELVIRAPSAPLKPYLSHCGLADLETMVVRQPEFFERLVIMLQQRPLADWKDYLRWNVVRANAPYLHAAAENEHFSFYGKVLRDQQVLEPRWQRASRMVDAGIGEALGQMFVEKHFPPAARARMIQLVDDVKTVVRDRLQKLEWMTQPTRDKALAKFARFTTKIGHPEKFRDYSSVDIRPDDLLGNVQRARAFETRRFLARIGKPVDRSEWFMTPQTVNAYFNPFQNEIVFPAGILQPPFFDLDADDAINYGAIGVVIGHEITHGYDDQGRKFDADGNLNDWWTDADAKAFEARSKKLVAQYAAYEALPGLNLNGELTLGENIADLGGTSIAYEALQRALARDPARRKKIDGFTPEQRFFLSLAQLWRTNIKEAELRRRVTVDPHSPGMFRAFGAHVNLEEFFDAFEIKPGDKMWREPEVRARIW